MRVRFLWRCLLGIGASNKALRDVIERVESLKEEAAQRLLTQNPTEEDLRCIIENVESLRQEATVRLEQKNIQRV